MKTKIKSRPRRRLNLDLQNAVNISVKKIKRQDALQAVRTILEYIGENPNRPGLIKTPERVIKAWENDWGCGYSKKFIQQETLSILGAQFDDGAEDYNEMICVTDVPLVTFCEHHMAEVRGVAAIGYIPGEGKKAGLNYKGEIISPEIKPKILGLSKLARVVNMFSRRLQVQERLTNQIADFIQIHCKPRGVGVVIRARHSCMESRGVKAIGSMTTTSALRGEMLTDSTVRSEFLTLVRK
jgi:GTP cyclohydrolase IA